MNFEFSTALESYHGQISSHYSYKTACEHLFTIRTFLIRGQSFKASINFEFSTAVESYHWQISSYWFLPFRLATKYWWDTVQSGKWSWVRSKWRLLDKSLAKIWLREAAWDFYISANGRKISRKNWFRLNQTKVAAFEALTLPFTFFPSNVLPIKHGWFVLSDLMFYFNPV